MSIEIERKFLLRNDAWRTMGQGTTYRQGYLSVEPARSVRVRLAGAQAWLTIKGKSEGISRQEYEYAIPVEDAIHMLDHLCQQPLIEKVRYRIHLDGLCWEVDEFAGANRGLIMAEVELDHPDQAVNLPDWIGEEVTGDPRYYNAAMVANPFTNWG